MEPAEILTRIEEILAKEKEALKSDEKEQSSGDMLKEIFLLLFQFVISLLKAPFRFVAGYVKNELVSAVKKDSKLMAFISAMLMVLLIFFFVLWISISVAVGAYFYDNGSTVFVSVLYSIGFQTISFLLVALLAYLFFRNLKTLKIYKSLTKNR